MRDKLFEGMLGTFTLREKGRVETGSSIGEWIMIGHRKAFFQQRERLIERSYQRRARSILL